MPWQCFYLKIANWLLHIDIQPQDHLRCALCISSTFLGNMFQGFLMRGYLLLGFLCQPHTWEGAGFLILMHLIISGHCSKMSTCCSVGSAKRFHLLSAIFNIISPSKGSAWLHGARVPFVLKRNIFSPSFQVSSRYFTFDEGREMLRWNLGRCEEGVLLLIKFYFLSPTPVLKRRPGTSREQFFLVSISLQKINLSRWSVEGTKEMKSPFNIFNISIRL